jgi:hypothetical protein
MHCADKQRLPAGDVYRPLYWRNRSASGVVDLAGELM